jgi:hypothetical protein
MAIRLQGKIPRIWVRSKESCPSPKCTDFSTAAIQGAQVSLLILPFKLNATYLVFLGGTRQCVTSNSTGSASL